VASGIRVAILGPVRAWRDQAELDIGPPQQRAVLGLLALHDEKPVSADELTDALWGDRMPSGARGTIRTYVYKLRQILGKDMLVSSRWGYMLAPDVAHVDLSDFCRLVEQARLLRAEGRLAVAAERTDEALALWQGPALAGVQGRYLDEQRAWLDELRLKAVEDRFDAAVELGRHAQVIAELTAAVAAQPFRERMRELLMLTLYRSGRQADALASYRDLRILLSQELGIDPGASLQSMHQRILQSDPALMAVPAAARPAAAPRVPSSVYHTARRHRCQSIGGTSSAQSYRRRR
jgi:DNA-binding SARP family transcriptional activator